MTTTTETINEQQIQRTPPGPQKLLWAGIGIIAYTSDFLIGIADKMWQLGQDIEDKTVTRMQDLRTMSRDTWHESEKQMRDVLDQRVDQVWHRVNVPTANDFAKMSNQLTLLNEKLDELSTEITKES
jgi:polyhydroxyalkanoate synthesis regulator phasin